jgi:DNA adenine methylase
MTDAAEMKIGALAPWFGGKRTMAPDIVRELGKHTQYFEPFCGSMSVLFEKEPSQKETVNDLHGDLINLARVVADDDLAPRLYDRLQRAIMCEGMLEDARDHLSDESSLSLIVAHHHEVPASVKLDRAFWYFVGSWMGRNGTAGTARLDYQIAVRWTVGGGSPTVRFANAVDSLPAWHRRLKNVVVLSRDAFMILDRFEDVPGTAIYADPPYASETRGECEKDSQGRYKHEFEHGGGALFGKRDDHQRLADMLRAYKRARIVVSAYDCPRYRELYDGWTFVDHTRQKHLHAQNGRGARPKEAPEVLIINGPSYTQGAA